MLKLDAYLIHDRNISLNPFINLFNKSLKTINVDLQIINIHKRKVFYRIISTYKLIKKPKTHFIIIRPTVIPFFLIIYIAKKILLKKIIVIYYPFELYGHQEGKVNYIIKFLEEFAIKNIFNLLITQNIERRNYYDAIDFKIEKVVLQNYKSKSIQLIEKKFKVNNLKQIVYVGSLIKGRCLDLIFEVISGLEDVQLVIYGKHKASKLFFEQHDYIIQRLISANKLQIISEIDESKIVPELLKYDVGIIPYSDKNLNNLFCAPAKLTEYLNAGLLCVVPPFNTFLNLEKKNKYFFTYFQENKNSLEKAILDAFNKVSLETKEIISKNADELNWENEFNDNKGTLIRYFK